MLVHCPPINYKQQKIISQIHKKTVDWFIARVKGSKTKPTKSSISIALRGIEVNFIHTPYLKLVVKHVGEGFSKT